MHRKARGGGASCVAPLPVTPLLRERSVTHTPLRQQGIFHWCLVWAQIVVLSFVWGACADRSKNKECPYVTPPPAVRAPPWLSVRALWVVLVLSLELNINLAIMKVALAKQPHKYNWNSTATAARRTPPHHKAEIWVPMATGAQVLMFWAQTRTALCLSSSLVPKKWQAPTVRTSFCCYNSPSGASAAGCCKELGPYHCNACPGVARRMGEPAHSSGLISHW